jgi:hypothetical protein
MIIKTQFIFHQNERPSAIAVDAVGGQQKASIHGADTAVNKRFV